MSYIVPRDKPKRCMQPKCRFMDRNTLDCRLQGKSWESFEEQYEHCPLIEIHTPPERKLQKLAEEIAAVKRSIKSENRDYLTGYLSALSAVEGMIAEESEVTT